MTKKKPAKKTAKKTQTKLKAVEGEFQPNPRGRPPWKYKPEFCEDLLEYFDVEPYREVIRINKKTGNEYEEIFANRLPTLAGFAVKKGINTNTISKWSKRYPDFGIAVSRAKAKAEDLLVTNGLLGLYNPQAFQFVAKNYTAMRDKTEIEVTELPLSDMKLQDLVQLRLRLENQRKALSGEK